MSDSERTWPDGIPPNYEDALDRIQSLQARLEAAEKDRHDFACGYRQTSEALLAARARIAELEMPVTDEEVAKSLDFLGERERYFAEADAAAPAMMWFRQATGLIRRLSRQSKSAALLVEAETALRSLVSERHEHGDHCPCPWCNARAILSKIEQGGA